MKVAVATVVTVMTIKRKPERRLLDDANVMTVVTVIIDDANTMTVTMTVMNHHVNCQHASLHPTASQRHVPNSFTKNNLRKTRMIVEWQL